MDPDQAEPKRCPGCDSKMRYVDDATAEPARYEWRCECGRRELSTVREYLDRYRARVRAERK